jgi:hypothetical protein
MQQQLAFAQLSDASNIQILSAHILGSWNLDLKSVLVYQASKLLVHAAMSY